MPFSALDESPVAAIGVRDAARFSAGLRSHVTAARLADDGCAGDFNFRQIASLDLRVPVALLRIAVRPLLIATRSDRAVPLWHRVQQANSRRLTM